MSEIMLQQTPVARVLPVYDEWLARWPLPSALAAETPGEAVRAWGRLGYPRRALRLHSAARVMVASHGGRVPERLDELTALPGIGAYTAAAVASFAYGQRHAVLDTNVRRVLARVIDGAQAPAPLQTVGELRRAQALLPAEATAPRWAVALMELGALVCTARSPRCAQCPIADACAWQRAGRPPYDGPPRRTQAYAGTDRHVRGLLLARLRAARAPLTASELAEALGRAEHWADDAQRTRALLSLVADGLAERCGEDAYRLPAGRPEVGN